MVKKERRQGWEKMLQGKYVKALLYKWYESKGILFSTTPICGQPVYVRKTYTLSRKREGLKQRVGYLFKPIGGGFFMSDTF